MTFKRSRDKYVVAINVDDLKQVIVHKKGKQVVDVNLSNHELTLDLNEAQVQRFELELSNRYHLVTIGTSILVRKNNNAYSAILKLDTEDKTVYVWPRGLSMIGVIDNNVSITIYGQEDDMDIVLEETPSATDVANVFGLLNVV